MPKYAGIFSSSWAVLNKDKNYGVTWHKITKQIDAGEILINKKFAIKKNATSYNLDTKSILVGINFFKKIINKIEKNKLYFKKENIKKRTYFGKSDLKNLMKQYNLIKNKDLYIKAFTLSPQKNILFKKIVGKNLNFNKSPLLVKKIKQNKSKNLNLIKFIKFFEKTMNLDLKSYNKRKLKIEEFSLNNHPKWDSLAHVKLLSSIEKKFNISIMKKI